MPALNDLSPEHLDLLTPEQIDVLPLEQLESTGGGSARIEVVPGNKVAASFTTGHPATDFTADDYLVLLLRIRAGQITPLVATFAVLQEHVKELVLSIDVAAADWQAGDVGVVQLVLGDATAFRTFIAVEACATAANQTTILNRLGAWTGAGRNTILGAFQSLFRSDADATVPSDINADLGSGAGTANNTTDSAQAIRDRGDAEWTSGDVTVTPLDASVRGTRVTGGTIELYQFEVRTVLIPVLDADEEPVDLSGMTLRLVVHDSSTPQPTGYFQIEHAAITVNGDDSNQANVPFTQTHTATQRTGTWSLWDVQDPDAPAYLGRGTFDVAPALHDVG